MMFAHYGDGCVQCEKSSIEDNLELCKDDEIIYTNRWKWNLFRCGCWIL